MDMHGNTPPGSGSSELWAQFNADVPMDESVFSDGLGFDIGLDQLTDLGFGAGELNHSGVIIGVDTPVPSAAAALNQQVWAELHATTHNALQLTPDPVAAGNFAMELAVGSNWLSEEAPGFASQNEENGRSFTESGQISQALATQDMSSSSSPGNSSVQEHPSSSATEHDGGRNGRALSSKGKESQSGSEDVMDVNGNQRGNNKLKCQSASQNHSDTSEARDTPNNNPTKDFGDYDEILDYGEDEESEGEGRGEEGGSLGKSKEASSGSVQNVDSTDSSSPSIPNVKNNQIDLNPTTPPPGSLDPSTTESHERTMAPQRLPRTAPDSGSSPHARKSGGGRGVHHHAYGEVWVASTSDDEYPELSPPPESAKKLDARKEKAVDSSPSPSVHGSDDVMDEDDVEPGAHAPSKVSMGNVGPSSNVVSSTQLKGQVQSSQFSELSLGSNGEVEQNQGGEEDEETEEEEGEPETSTKGKSSVREGVSRATSRATGNRSVKRAKKITSTIKPTSKRPKSRSKKEQEEECIITEEDIERMATESAPRVPLTEQYFCGLADIDVVLPYCGGGGVKLVPFDKGRPQNDAQVEVLAKRGMDGLFVKDLPYSMIVMLPKGSYDPSSLTTDPSKVEPIKWTEAANSMVGYIANGNHRRAALVKLQEHRIQALRVFQAQIASLEEKNQPEGAKEVREKRDAFLKRIKGHFYWRVRVYDLDGIRNDPIRTSIEMKLASNNVVHTLPENESDAFVALLRYMVDAPDVETRTKTIRDASNLLVNDQHRHLGLLLRRGMPLISLIVDLRSHKSFSHFPVHPKELAQFNLFAWGFLQPVFEGLKHELVFLSTELALPSSVVNDPNADLTNSQTVREVKSTLRNVIRHRSQNTHPISEPVYDCLVEAAENLWEELEINQFDLGSNSSRYREVMRTYAERITARVTSEIRDWKEEHPDKWDELDERVAALLPLKLKVLVGSTILAGAHLMPRLPGPLPLLCPSMLIYFVTHWTEFPNILFTIVSWFVPGIRHVSGQIKGHGGEDADPPFFSYPSGILHTLKYWAGYYQPLPGDRTWSELTMDEVMQLRVGPKNEYIHEWVRKAFYGVIHILFDHQPLLRDLERVLPFLTPPDKKTKVSLPSDISSLLTSHAHATLEAWVKSVQRTLKEKTGREAKLSDVSPRILPKVPADVTRAIASLSQGRETLQALVRVLEYCPLNFLIPSNPNNRATHHLSMLKQIWLEYDYQRFSLIPTSQEVDQVRWLYHAIQDKVSGIAGLEDFELWPRMPRPVNEKLSPISEKLFSAKELQENIEKRSKAFDERLLKFVRSLAKPDCLGIPVEVPAKKKGKSKTTSCAHPALQEFLVGMHKAAQPLFEHLATIDVIENLADWPEPPEMSEYDNEYWDEQGLQLPVAPDYALDTYYKVEEVEEVKKARGQKRMRDEEETEEEEDDDTGESGSEDEGVPAKRARSAENSE